MLGTVTLDYLLPTMRLWSTKPFSGVRTEQRNSIWDSIIN